MTTETTEPRTEAADRALTLLGGDWDSPTGRLLLAIEAEAARTALEGVAERVLPALSDDDVMYDHPVAQSGEPMDPVLFVRWDSVLALLSSTEGSGK